MSSSHELSARQRRDLIEELSGERSQPGARDRDDRRTTSAARPARAPPAVMTRTSGARRVHRPRRRRCTQRPARSASCAAARAEAVSRVPRPDARSAAALAREAQAGLMPRWNGDTSRCSSLGVPRERARPPSATSRSPSRCPRARRARRRALPSSAASPAPSRARAGSRRSSIERDAGAQPRRPRRALLAVRVHQLGQRAVERRVAGDQLVEHAAERVDVRRGHRAARHCSGAMYAGVPAIEASSGGGSSTRRDTPKSMTLTRRRVAPAPIVSTNRFSGLTSQWTTPAACSAASAARDLRAERDDRRRGRARRARRSARASRRRGTP